jgi:hypothetical protein
MNANPVVSCRLHEEEGQDHHHFQDNADRFCLAGPADG